MLKSTVAIQIVITCPCFVGKNIDIVYNWSESIMSVLFQAEISHALSVIYIYIVTFYIIFSTCKNSSYILYYSKYSISFFLYICMCMHVYIYIYIYIYIYTVTFYIYNHILYHFFTCKYLSYFRLLKPLSSSLL